MKPHIEKLFSGDKARKSNYEKFQTIKEDCIRNLHLMELDIYKPIADAYAQYRQDKDKEALNKVKEQFQMNNIKLQNYELDREDIIEILDRFDLGRFKAWMSYNNYI